MTRLAALALLVASTTSVHASDPPAPSAGTFFGRLAADMRAQVDAAIIARPPRRPAPKPVSLRWKLVKLGTLELGAPLVALTGADLDGDRKAELYAVTTREVIAIGVVGKQLRELGRVAFAGEPALGGPRDVVGTAVADGASVVASVSTWKHALRVSRAGGVLVATLEEGGFWTCPGERLELVPGRNYFTDGKVTTYGARCGASLADNDGYPLRVRAQLSLASKLDIAIERCAATNLGCQLAGRYEYAGVGYAFELADLDRDGRPEVLYAGAGAPGDPDVLKIVRIGDDARTQPLLRKPLKTGGIVGVTAVDLDGNGTRDAVAAVRVLGATQLELWRVE